MYCTNQSTGRLPVATTSTTSSSRFYILVDDDEQEEELTTTTNHERIENKSFDFVLTLFTHIEEFCRTTIYIFILPSLYLIILGFAQIDFEWTCIGLCNLLQRKMAKKTTTTATLSVLKTKLIN